MSHARAARLLLRRALAGTLCTHSVKQPGYPFGTAVAFLPAPDGSPEFLVSGLAEHTRNLLANPRASLFVLDAGADPQSGARLTLVGDAQALGRPEASARRFARVFPEAEQWLALGDFGFWRLAPRALRWVAGFGSMGWVEPESYSTPAPALEAAEAELLARLDPALLAARLGLADNAVEPLALDPDGLHLRAGGKVLRLDLAAEARDPDSFLAALAR